MFQIRLKELRESKGISQYKLAQAIGVAQSTVGMWENGTNKPENMKLVKLSEFFDVSTDYLLGKTDQKKSSAENGKGLDKNTVVIVGRDGRRIEKKLSDEQIKALEMMVEQLPPFEL